MTEPVPGPVWLVLFLLLSGPRCRRFPRHPFLLHRLVLPDSAARIGCGRTGQAGGHAEPAARQWSGPDRAAVHGDALAHAGQAVPGRFVTQAGNTVVGNLNSQSIRLVAQRDCGRHVALRAGRADR